MAIRGGDDMAPGHTYMHRALFIRALIGHLVGMGPLGSVTI